MWSHFSCLACLNSSGVNVTPTMASASSISFASSGPRDGTIFTFGAETASSFTMSGDRLAMTFLVCAGSMQQETSSEYTASHGLFLRSPIVVNRVTIVLPNAELPARDFGRECTIRGTIEFCDSEASAGHGGGAHGCSAGNGDCGDLRPGRAAVSHAPVSFGDRAGLGGRAVRADIDAGAAGPAGE